MDTPKDPRERTEGRLPGRIFGRRTASRHEEGLTAELDLQRARASLAREEADAAREELAEATSELSRLRQLATQAARTARELAEQREESRKLAVDLRDLREAALRPHPVLAELIRTADQLVDVRDGTESGRLEPQAVLRWLERRIRTLLAESELTEVRDTGPVDPARHEVLRGVPAGPGGQSGWIVATVRPGYRWRELMLRPQQVVATAPGPDAAAAPDIAPAPEAGTGAGSREVQVSEPGDVPQGEHARRDEPRGATQRPQG
ncbi:hypothetical protein [Streptomyces sp. NPDC096339]|uniref:hypothetical protein n=1 Tax=Streptomyces sp. NPDC096339 TaxID=3366086 RepID=UPI003810E09E